MDFINGVMIDSNFATFKSVEIINPFNLSKYLDGKESIVDVTKGRRANHLHTSATAHNWLANGTQREATLLSNSLLT